MPFQVLADSNKKQHEGCADECLRETAAQEEGYHRDRQRRVEEYRAGRALQAQML